MQQQSGTGIQIEPTSRIHCLNLTLGYTAFHPPENKKWDSFTSDYETKEIIRKVKDGQGVLPIQQAKSSTPLRPLLPLMYTLLDIGIVVVIGLSH